MPASSEARSSAFASSAVCFEPLGGFFVYATGPVTDWRPACSRVIVKLNASSEGENAMWASNGCCVLIVQMGLGPYAQEKRGSDEANW